MIHSNSNDPVLIRKIELEVWTLRDEVEHTVEKLVETSRGDQKVLFQEISKIHKEYVKAKNYHEDKDNVTSIRPTPEGDAEESSSEAPAGEEAPGTEGTEEEAAVPTEEGGETGEVSEFPGVAVAHSEDENVLLFQKRPDMPVFRKFRGMTVLAEITMDGIYFFTDRDLLSGQNIVLDFLIPRRFLLNAEIIFCRPYNLRSRIISKQSLNFRCGAKFTFPKEGQRTLLREFLETIEPDYTPAPQKPKKIAKKEDDDDIDDLDDLDL